MTHNSPKGTIANVWVGLHNEDAAPTILPTRHTIKIGQLITELDNFRSLYGDNIEVRIGNDDEHLSIDKELTFYSAYIGRNGEVPAMVVLND